MMDQLSYRVRVRAALTGFAKAQAAILVQGGVMVEENRIAELVNGHLAQFSEPQDFFSSLYKEDDHGSGIFWCQPLLDDVKRLVGIPVEEELHAGAKRVHEPSAVDDLCSQSQIRHEGRYARDTEESATAVVHPIPLRASSAETLRRGTAPTTKTSQERIVYAQLHHKSGGKRERIVEQPRGRQQKRNKQRADEQEQEQEHEQEQERSMSIIAERQEGKCCSCIALWARTCQLHSLPNLKQTEMTTTSTALTPMTNQTHGTRRKQFCGL